MNVSGQAIDQTKPQTTVVCASCLWPTGIRGKGPAGSIFEAVELSRWAALAASKHIMFAVRCTEPVAASFICSRELSARSFGSSNAGDPASSSYLRRGHPYRLERTMRH